MPDTVEKLKNAGVEPLTRTPQQYGEFLKAEIALGQGDPGGRHQEPGLARSRPFGGSRRKGNAMRKRLSLLFLLLAAAVLQIRIDGIAAVDGTGRGAACRYALSPEGKAFDSEGGTGRISVAATGNCTWRAVSNAPSWLTVTSGAGGAGNGTVGYRVAPNTGVSRSGTLTVAGRTFAVDQTASPCCQVSARGSAAPTPVSTDRHGSGEGT